MHAKDVSNKIWLQQEALRAMPHDLYEEAIKIDDTPPPANRPWPFFDTPPIEDFNIKDYIKSGDGEDDDEEEEAKSRMYYSEECQTMCCFVPIICTQ